MSIPRQPDLTVLGGGIFGLSIAWEAVRRGARVRLVERSRIGAGSSGGLVGALAPHVPENWNAKKQFQLEALLMAEPWWREIAEVSGIDPGYARRGRVQLIADARGLALAQDRIAGAQTHWGSAATWEVRPDPADGWVPPSPTGQVIHDTLSACLHPRHAAAALAAALNAKGAEVIEGATDAPSGPCVEATGAAGLEALSAELGRSVGAAVKGQAALLGHDARDRPQLFLDGLHIVPHGDGTVAIGSTSERDFTDGSSTDAALDALIDKARALCPALAEAPVLERWAGLRPRAKSRAPMLGPHPSKARTWIANGGFKIGFGMAPKVAQVMVDLALDGRDTIPEGFRVDDNL